MDIAQIAALMYRAFVRLRSENAHFPEPDMVYAMQAMLDLIAQDLVFLAQSESGTIVGILALDYSRWAWTSPQNPKGYYLYNQHFWVAPEARRFSNLAGGLIDTAKAKALEKQLPLILDLSSVLDTPQRMRARDRYIRTKGFVCLGGKFCHSPGAAP